ncbi:flagellar export protein FliJ [Ferrimonas balearica]|uniref:flagellar export protein FliJ n=1 Tax=Ferrimonas balearica TaxID=44012 RepID=UPI001C59CEC9|nr:flagellar export protein FliJ [Ferrimonas balearica]MBW3164290.1 flagellar export protein FliJ [Ferrimonas balearica]
MSDPNQLAQVLGMADKALEKAALDLRSAHSAVQALKQQLTQLQNYRWDYVKQAQQQAGTTLQASHYQQYHHFIAKLDAAITQHIARVRQAEAAAQQRQTLWQQAHQRQQAIALLLEKNRTRAAALAEKRSQRELDEFALQQFVRRQR